MLKPKIYLDTSVISHLCADDAVERKNETLALWEQLKKGEYDIVISNVTIKEIRACKSDELKEKLLSFVAELDSIYVEENEESLKLADEYIERNVLTQKSIDDCRHIAVASIFNCKYILSWNFKHFVNIKTIDRVHMINEELGLCKPIILPPTIFLESEED